MISIIGKRVISTSVYDARFLKGENIEDAFKRESDYGKGIDIFFDDGTFLAVQALDDGDGEHIVGCGLGTWESVEGSIVIRERP